ncbi:type IX secretion system sortase PorU [Tenacibaculum maritimum]|uniref:type IX secretion system sortase PorU n=1 Tax=Tenacibaculum maritimum TaxID=107401 RepID=UPI0038768744
MKKIIFLFCFTYSLCVLSQRNSILSEGNWYKFSIHTTGVFKLDANFLKNLGINTSTINPKNIKIYGNGGSMLPELNTSPRKNGLQENAIYVKGEEDRKFNSDDYILFYAKGPHSWNINTTNLSVAHQQNIYSDKSFYFLTIGDTPGKRITEMIQPNEGATNTIHNFDDFIFYEKENQNLFAVGRLWFGEDFNFENTRNFKINFPDAVPNSEITIRLSAVSKSPTTSSMKLIANGVNTINLTFPPTSNSSSSSLAFLRKGEGKISAGDSDEININITFNNNGIPSAKAYLDFIEVIGLKKLRANNKQFSFRNFTTINSNNVFKYEIENANAIFQVWDVSDYLNPKSINSFGNSNSFQFKAKGGPLKEFIVLNSSDFYTPIIIGNPKISNQNLHGLKDIQYLIITSKELVSQAQRLAEYHQNNSNLSTQVISLNQIYNEFASGSPDITGIRDFIKYLHDNSSASKKLQYVCFFGDSSYDYKDRINGNNNIVPTFHATQSFDLVSSYVTDDYFVMIGNNKGGMNATDTIDIASGRIPVSTQQEAKIVVDKILSYYHKTSFGDWRNTITLIADDIDQGADITLQRGLEEIADAIKKYKPILNINKIYADAFKQENSSGGERYPLVKNAITNSIEKGALVFNYFGHGGEDGLASERIVEIPQINSFNNFNTLPLFITVTCEFSRFDNPLRNTAGEKLFLNPKGGAVSMITTTRAVFIPIGERFNKKLANNVLNFDGSDKSIAENLIKTKNETNSIQKFFIYYFGDPAMQLAIPKPNILLTKMNGKSITSATDTLKALSKVNFEGIVTDRNNNLLHNFNGTLATTVFDKPIDKTTLDNNNFGVTMVFDSQESKLFKGKSSIKNGTFKFDFIVPKDIKVAYGKGKLSFYASNEKIDKSGANFDIVVGGINPNANKDTTGPAIKAFMNDDSFIDGGNTNTSPNLIINLSDSSGINTSVTAVDHDIIAILDDDQSNPIILNDYYETELDDFTKGKVTYQLRNLSVGKHTLKIKAWDTYNNSSEVTLAFVVVSDTTLVLDNVLNYPNPFVNYTEFWFNHNKPNEPLQAQVQIFTISGKLIKTINQNIQTTGNLSRSITWNGLDDFGNKIGKGVYLYKLKVKSTINNLVSEKYEKLVILQ